MRPMEDCFFYYNTATAYAVKSHFDHPPGYNFRLNLTATRTCGIPTQASNFLIVSISTDGNAGVRDHRAAVIT